MRELFEIPKPVHGVHFGATDSNNSNNNITSGTNDNSSNSNDAASLLQRLAAVVQSQQNQTAANGTHRVDSMQQETMTQMGIMLAQLAMNNNNNHGNMNTHVASGENNSIGGTIAPQGVLHAELPLQSGNSTAARPESLFFSSHASRQNNSSNYGIVPQHPPSIVRNGEPPSTRHKPISHKEQAFYAEERALLRELIVLTMRNSNGNILRFVPSLEEQTAQIIRDEGYQNKFKFPKGLVAEGVRISPHVTVIPSLENNDQDGQGSSSYHDLEFCSKLSMPLLGSGARDAISLCGECGWLYGKISDFVSSVLEMDFDGYHGSVARALASRFDRELGEYHRQLSLLESELPPLNMLAPSGTTPQSVEHKNNVRYLTLRALLARIPPIRNHLRTLAILADGVGARNLRGGKLLASTLRHSLDVDSRHSILVRSIGADASVPWYKLLSQWVTQGALEDGHLEFFVAEVQPADKSDRKSSGYFTWHKRYVLVEGQIPLCSSGGMMEMMTVDLAREVLLVGKGINFIRSCLLDKDWEVFDVNEDGKDDANVEANDTKNGYGFVTLMDVGGNDDKFQCLSTLHRTVVKSSTRIHSHIIEMMEKQHHLMCHLLALKHFLFLGQGDFVTSFVESLNKEFRGRTSTAGIYSHTLAAVVDGALRTTNARYLPNYVLGNLRGRLMIDENDPDRYWMGPPPKTKTDEMVPWVDNESSIQDPWDYVCLEYHIDSPLDAIVHASAMETYHRVFLFLFRLKRVEWMLNNSWRQSTALNHAILIETKAGGVDAPSVMASAEKSSFLLRRISTIRQTMLHFVSNLQNYLMFEVLEGGWNSLVRSIDKARTLDDIIHAHDSYLNEIVVKTLVSNMNNDSDSKGKSKTLENQLRKLLSIALKFGKFQDHIFTNALAALNKAAKSRRATQSRAKKTWGRTTVDEDEGKVFHYLADAKLFQYVERTAKEFDKVLGDLLKMLNKQVYDFDHTVDGNVDDKCSVLRNHEALHFLLFRLDFSGYYARQSRVASRK